MSLIIIAIIFSYICYKFGDWKNWRIYYPTILFYVIGNSTEHIVTYKKSLWSVTCMFHIDTVADWFIEFLIYPSIIILFLSRYPKTLVKRILYICSFVFVLTIIEYLGYANKEILYYNGWNIIWTILLYFGMFALFLIHNKWPILAWLILSTLVFAGMFYFNIPIVDLKRH